MNDLNLENCPILSRNESFKLTLNELYKNFDDPNIVEIGCIREINDAGAGNSSEIWSWYVTNYGGYFTTCDISEKNIKLCHNYLMSKKYKNTTCICKEGREFLLYLCANEQYHIDLLYLDGMDADDKIYMNSAEFHLNCFKLCEKNISNKGLVLIDDNFNTTTYEGKGFKLIPYLLNNTNYECLFMGYQVLFRKNI